MNNGYRAVVILIFITVISFLSVDIFYKVMNAQLSQIDTEKSDNYKAKVSTKKIIPKTSMNSYRVISKRNLFGSIETANGGKDIDLDTLEPTELKLSLLGTVASSGEFEFAVIEEKEKKKQGLFRVGDQVADASVIKILRGRVVLRVDGKDEILKIEERKSNKNDRGRVAPRPARTTPINKVMLNRTDVENAMQDVNNILSQIRVRPYFSKGKADGFMVSSIKRGSIFQKMGLRNRDIIQGINNSPIGSPDDIFDRYKGLESGSETILNIKRRGKQQNLNYVFK